MLPHATLLLMEDRLEKSWLRAKREANREERAYWRIHCIMVHMRGPSDPTTTEAWRAHMDACARVRDRLASRWADLELARRIESEWEMELEDVRGELRRIDELHQVQDQYENH